MQFSGNSALFLGSFIAYIALMILIGWFASRKVSKGGTAFLTGGGHLPVFLTVCTAAATLIGTGGTMGRTGQAFSGGLACFGYVIVGPVTLLILGLYSLLCAAKTLLPWGRKSSITMVVISTSEGSPVCSHFLPKCVTSRAT